MDDVFVGGAQSSIWLMYFRGGEQRAQVGAGGEHRFDRRYVQSS